MAGETVNPDLIMKKFDPPTKAEKTEPDSGEVASPESPSAGTDEGAREKPDPKASLRKSLNSLADIMRRTQVGWLAHFGFLRIDERFRKLRDACQDLQIEFLSLPDDERSLLQFQSKVDDLHASYNRLRFRLIQTPSAIISAVLLFCIGFVVIKSGLIAYLQDKLELNKVMRYVLMAVIGAILWGLTSILSRRESDPEHDSSQVTFGSLLLRILIAIVVPTVIVMLTFTKSGAPMKFGQIWKSPEAWSFLAGYSCQLIVLGLNKLVDKVTKMIESI